SRAHRRGSRTAGPHRTAVAPGLRARIKAGRRQLLGSPSPWNTASTPGSTPACGRGPGIVRNSRGQHLRPRPARLTPCPGYAFIGHAMSMPTIPSTSFATEQLPGDEQFDAWRQAISVVFDVAPLHEAKKGFRAKVRAFHLGELLLVNTRFDSQRFVRSQRQARSDWMDHFLVQYYRRGGYAGTVDDRGIRTPPGSVSVLDLARG